MDLVEGVMVRLLSSAGVEILTGMLRVKDDGLHLSGHGPNRQGLFSESAEARMFREGVLVGGLWFGLLASVLVDDDESHLPWAEVALPWPSIESIEVLEDRMRVTRLSADARGGGTAERREAFDIVLTSTTGDAGSCLAAVYEQILKYRKYPSLMPHCPGCKRVVKKDVRRCAYCGAKW